MSDRSVHRMSIRRRASAAAHPFLTPKADILPFVGHRVSYVAYRLKYDRRRSRNADRWEKSVNCFFTQAVACLY
jgi:hypothetical protein